MKSDAPHAELFQTGRSLQQEINRLQDQIRAHEALHGLRLSIARAKADLLPQPPPEGVFYLITRHRPSGSDEPSPPDWAFITTQRISFQEAERRWAEVEASTAALRQEQRRLWKELEEVDLQVRDYSGAERRPDGTWVLRNQRGGTLQDKDAFGRPIRDEATLRRLAYAHWREYVFAPSPFGIADPQRE